MTDRTIVIGAGPNGLAAAVTLARAGVPVEVYERASFLGGGTRTAEITLPGFRHDICSAVAGLGRDGGAWLSLMRPFVEHAERVADLISGPLLRLPARPWELLGLGLAVLEQGSPLWNLRWRGEEAPALWLTTPAPTVPPSSPASRWRPSPTSQRERDVPLLRLDAARPGRARSERLEGRHLRAAPRVRDHAGAVPGPTPGVNTGGGRESPARQSITPSASRPWTSTKPSDS